MACGMNPSVMGVSILAETLLYPGGSCTGTGGDGGRRYNSLLLYVSCLPQLDCISGVSQGLLLKPPWGLVSSWGCEQLRSQEREQHAGCSTGVSRDTSELQL